MRGGGYYSRGGGSASSATGGHRGASNASSGITQRKSGSHGHGHDDRDRDQKEKKKRDAIFDLKKYSDKRIRVKFMGGREVTGVLKGSDQLLNIVLDEAEETLHVERGHMVSRTAVNSRNGAVTELDFDTISSATYKLAVQKSQLGQKVASALKVIEQAIDKYGYVRIS
ncbi:U6 snRNP-associated protein Lsm7 [Coemansia erecta]|nr:U6 snRNP-associated protein Lsm7 [Coemansia erecta]